MVSTKKLLQIMAQLRDPENGCPWDVEQNYASIAPYTVEEAYEVADAIERGNFDDLRDELGDLLLQVVFLAQIASEEKRFTFEDVAASICDKLVRRHPHVFAGASIEDAKAQEAAWEESKKRERAQRAGGLLDDVPGACRRLAAPRSCRSGQPVWDSTGPALRVRAQKLLRNWRNLTRRLRKALRPTSKKNWGMRFLRWSISHVTPEADPETALQSACRKFSKRFAYMESALAAAGSSVHEADADSMDRLWNEAKRQSR